jgi:hypothetical protein
MKPLITILLLFICSIATAQEVKQYQCFTYTIRGKAKEDTVNISLSDSLVFIQLPGHDQSTLHNYVLRVKTRHRKGPETYYFLVFMKSRRTATLLVNDYHLYFTHDREEYLYSLCYRY